MLNKTYKLKHLHIKIIRSLACLLALAAIILPAPAFAVSLTSPSPGPPLNSPVFTPMPSPKGSKKYEIVCQGSEVNLSHNSISCSSAPAIARVVAIGGVEKPYPSGAGVAVITVSCGSSSPVDPSVNGKASFKCHNGSKPKLKNLNVVQKHTDAGGGGGGGGGGGATITGDPAAQIAACKADPSGPGCGSDTNAYCGPDNCDLVEKYVNPLIDVISIAFGIIAVISLILGGIQYSASAGDPQKVTAAKHRISQTLYAILAYAFLFAILQFLVPGGVFH